MSVRPGDFRCRENGAVCLGCGLRANGTDRGFTLEVLETHYRKCRGRVKAIREDFECER